MKTNPCPVCGVTFDVPEYPPLLPQLADIFGTTAVGLAETHHHQNMRRLENQVSRHMETHSPAQWLLAVRERDTKIRALEERLAERGVL